MDRAYRAAEAGDWGQVVRILGRLHGRGLVTPTSRHWLGLAYLQLERWQDALDEYEQIRGPLPEHDAEARRIVNHAIARFELGQRTECARLLKEKISNDWPVKEVQRAKRLLAEIEAEQ